MARPNRGTYAAATVDEQPRSPPRITRKIRWLRQKSLSAMRSEKVNTDLCEVTVSFRSDCKQKCHYNGESVRHFETPSVTHLIWPTLTVLFTRISNATASGSPVRGKMFSRRPSTYLEESTRSAVRA